jgi:hypothetical protein
MCRLIAAYHMEPQGPQRALAHGSHVPPEIFKELRENLALGSIEVVPSLGQYPGCNAVLRLGALEWGAMLDPAPVTSR